MRGEVRTGRGDRDIALRGVISLQPRPTALFRRARAPTSGPFPRPPDQSGAISRIVVIIDYVGVSSGKLQHVLPGTKGGTMSRRRAFTLAISPLAAGALLFASTAPATAAPNSPKQVNAVQSNGLAAPVTATVNGATSSGSLTITRFVRQASQILAVGNTAQSGAGNLAGNLLCARGAPGRQRRHGRTDRPAQPNPGSAEPLMHSVTESPSAPITTSAGQSPREHLAGLVMSRRLRFRVTPLCARTLVR